MVDAGSRMGRGRERRGSAMRARRSPHHGPPSGPTHQRSLRRFGCLVAAVMVGLLVPAPLRGGAAVLLAAVAGIGLLQAVAVGFFASTARTRSLDPLTGLADAASFRAFVHAELDGSDRRLGLLWLELRQVGLLRSTFGREALEALYGTIALRLRRAVRSQDAVAHFGDGLFAVALRDSGDAEDFTRAAERLRAEVARPVVIAGTRVRPSWVVAGVAAPADGDTGDALLAAAETARDTAQAGPGEPFRRLAAGSCRAAEDRRHRRRELLEAAESGAFFPLFQPQLDLATGAVDRCEVLMRWQRADGGVTAPGMFLDELRLIDALPRVSDVVYRAAFHEAVAWRAAGLPLHRLAVNLDATQVAVAGWAEHLLAALGETALPPSSVEVEVSENILADADLAGLVDGLATLRRAGVAVSLDDFGTGYASLTQIADLPIDLVKIDARLLWDAARRGRTQIVVDGIVDLLRKLALPCVFEGVETPEHLALARRLGARWAQGFLVGRPMSAPELETRLVRPATSPRPMAPPRLVVG
jgi:EAL domain-containing protein (putative c-di-GMP-specific phosphodiesterase class I)